MSVAEMAAMTASNSPAPGGGNLPGGGDSPADGVAYVGFTHAAHHAVDL